MKQSELNDLVSLTQLILGDVELGKSLRKIVETDHLKRQQYVVAPRYL